MHHPACMHPFTGLPEKGNSCHTCESHPRGDRREETCRLPQKQQMPHSCMQGGGVQMIRGGDCLGGAVEGQMH